MTFETISAPDNQTNERVNVPFEERRITASDRRATVSKLPDGIERERRSIPDQRNLSTIRGSYEQLDESSYPQVSQIYPNAEKVQANDSSASDFDAFNAAKARSIRIVKSSGNITALPAGRGGGISLSGDVFTEQRKHGTFDRGTYLSKIERICNALSITGIVPDDAIERSYEFAERAFDMYEGRVTPEYAGSHVFVIPTFVSENQKGEYNSEIETSYPVSQYLDSKSLVDMIAGVPPAIIESYPVDDDGKQAHVVFAPVMPDVFTDLGFAGGMRMSQRIVNDTIRFANEKIGARVAGLGAMLPLAVELGHKVDVDGIITTTGHGGTVELVARTVDRVVQEKGIANNSLGVIGARGSIGRASLSALLERYPDVQMIVHDTAFADGSGKLIPSATDKFCASYAASDRDRITFASNLTEVLNTAKVNVSAISSTIDVNKAIEGDMDDVVIVDDSQPGAFDRAAVEAKGGRVVWVVGQDYSAKGSLTRIGDFRFGDKGLSRKQDVFGCEAEAYVVYKSGDDSNAVRQRVNPDIQKNIGNLFTKFEIDVSDELQSDGRPVKL